MTNKLILTAAPYPLSPPPFEGMDSWSGAPMADPVSTPAPGVEALSVRERAADAGVLRDPDAEARAVYTDARPRLLRLMGGTPPAVRPAGVDNRGERHPLSNWPTPRPVVNYNPHGPGLHGELRPGVSEQASGSMQPGLFLRRNTFRLAPEPWDANYFVEPNA
jgi:hypothetical protein